MKTYCPGVVPLALLALCGCAPGYWRNRANDLRDIGKFKFSVGRGVQFNVRGTKLLQAGAGYVGGGSPETSVSRIGWNGRRFERWRETSRELGVGLAYWRSLSAEVPAGDGSWSRTGGSGQDGLDWDKGFWIGVDGKKDREWFGVGLAAHAGIGVDIEFRPLNVFDFLLGWIGLDISRDDSPPTDERQR